MPTVLLAACVLIGQLHATCVWNSYSFEFTCSSSKSDLVQNVYAYITEGTYPGGATANEKRVIRRKAKNFEVRDGELLYKLLYKNKRRRGRRYKVKVCSYSS